MSGRTRSAVAELHILVSHLDRRVSSEGYRDIVGGSGWVRSPGVETLKKRWENRKLQIWQLLSENLSREDLDCL